MVASQPSKSDLAFRETFLVGGTSVSFAAEVKNQ